MCLPVAGPGTVLGPARAHPPTTSSVAEPERSVPLSPAPSNEVLSGSGSRWVARGYRLSYLSVAMPQYSGPSFIDR